MRGKTISIYIPDSNPRGIKICDIQNSIVKAFYIPRNKIKDALNREELNSPWVYFLIWEKNELGKELIYIWEAETLIERLKQHNNKKDFWNSAICFISEKQNINKAHIKFLESYAYKEALSINKCELENSIIPAQSSLSEQEEDFALSFFDDIKILISTLGFPIFEQTKKKKDNIYICKWKEAYAKWEYTGDGFTVFKWSTVNLKESSTIWSWVTKIRKSLREKNVLISKDNVYEFNEDYTFSSPSTSAAVILARNANWWTEWKDEKWNTLHKNFREKAT